MKAGDLILNSEKSSGAAGLTQVGGVQSDTPLPLQKRVWRRRAPGLGEGSRGEGPHFRPPDFLPRGRVSETSRLLCELLPRFGAWKTSRSAFSCSWLRPGSRPCLPLALPVPGHPFSRCLWRKGAETSLRQLWAQTRLAANIKCHSTEEQGQPLRRVSSELSAFTEALSAAGSSLLLLSLRFLEGPGCSTQGVPLKQHRDRAGM